MHEFQNEAPNTPDWEMINRDEYTRKEEEKDVRSSSRPSQRRTSTASVRHGVNEARGEARDEETEEVDAQPRSKTEVNACRKKVRILVESWLFFRVTWYCDPPCDERSADRGKGTAYAEVGEQPRAREAGEDREYAAGAEPRDVLPVVVVPDDSHSPSRARVDIYALFHDMALIDGYIAPDDEAPIQEGGEKGWYLWQGETGGVGKRAIIQSLIRRIAMGGIAGQGSRMKWD
ncbi:hypothetical protein DFH09DRAFT_1295096 [Mycena vulgaris]|nr:hypothetical protein DFH09DRAFT_1295096 [Mycena vulgaris]